MKVDQLSSDTNIIRGRVWSGADVLVCDLKLRYTWSIFRDLNHIKKSLWLPGILGLLFYVRYFLRAVYENRRFNQFHILVLTVNTFFISEEDPLSENHSINVFNMILYVYFLMEIVLKIGGFGVKGKIL